MRKLVTCLVLAAGLLAGPARAQTLDPTFQATVLRVPATNPLAPALAVQPDGKVLLAGGFDFANGTLASKLIRLNADGTPDASFNPGGTGANGSVAAVALQPDGRLIIAGSFTTYNGVPQLAVARLTSSGTLDASFAGLPVASLRQFFAVAVQPDGKVLLGGTTGFNSTTPLPTVLRLTSSGALDASFTPPASVAGDIVRALVVQADGKIVLGGNGGTGSGLSPGTQRLNPDGTTDGTFQAGTTGVVYALALQPDGKVLLGGTLSTTTPSTQPGVVRLLPTGVVDNTFSTGTGVNSAVRTLALQADGSVLVGGQFTTVAGAARGRLARLLPTGTLDAGFAAGTGPNAPVLALATTAGGQVLAAGSFTQVDGGAARTGLTRLTATTGTEDAAFTSPLFETKGVVTRAAQLSNGRLLVQGSFATANGAPAPGNLNAVRRFNADGSLDATYSTTATGLLGAQPDGTFYYVTFNTAATLYQVRRVLPSGALDAGFANPEYQSSSAPTSFIQPQGITTLADGKVLVYGAFTTFGGVARNGLVRLNADGTVDGSFVPPAGTLQRQVFGLTVQPGGKLVLAYNELTNGSVVSVTGAGTVLLRLNADGSVDNTYNAGGTGVGPGVYLGVLPYPDGRLLLIGTGTYNGQPTPYGLTRVTVDGLYDNTFNQLAASYLPQLVQPDGRILAYTDGYNQTTYGSNALVRLRADGSRETTFAPISTPRTIFASDNYFYGFLYQASDDKILPYGGFTSLLGQVRGGLARVVPGVLTATTAPAAPRSLVVYPNPARQQLTVALPALAAGAQATLLSLTGQLVRQWPLPAARPEATLDLNAVAPGLYVLRLPGTSGYYQQKVVVAP